MLMEGQAQSGLVNGEAEEAEDAVCLFPQRWISADPLREEAYCAAMQLYVSLGRYAHALQQFEKLKQVLVEELRIEPGLAACNLAQAIRA
jgi:DNA-binding SARP family transcriptional activator